MSFHVYLGEGTYVQTCMVGGGAQNPFGAHHAPDLKTSLPEFAGRIPRFVAAAEPSGYRKVHAAESGQCSDAPWSWQGSVLKPLSCEPVSMRQPTRA